jgi:GTPase SAR1 family protein
MSIESATQLLFEQESFNNYLNKVALPDLFKGAFDTIGIDIYKKAISKYDFLSNALMHQLESEISGRLDDMKAEIVEDESKEIDGIIYLKILFYI